MPRKRKSPRSGTPQQILPPLPPESGDDPDGYLFDPDALPPALSFTPVPRKRIRSDGLSPIRQRAFIAHLAANGSVEMSAAAVGASDNAFYNLRRAEGAESFSAAWDVAIEMGARRVLDTLMAHAIHGVPEKWVKDGKVILERRRFNARAMMWIVQQRFPELYGGSLNVSGRPASSLPHGLQKLRDEWRAEWEAQVAARSPETGAEAAAETSAEEAAAESEMAATIERIARKYEAKVREEYHFRASGNAIAADFVLRQLAQIELVLEAGGLSQELIVGHFHNAPYGGPWSTPVSRALEDARHAAWEKASGEALRQRERDEAQAAATAQDAAQNGGQDAGQYAGSEAGSDAAQGATGPARPTLEPYTRPRMPFYLTEEDMAKDEAAQAALQSHGGTHRERTAAEAEWRENRQVESDKPEGDTFLPGE